MADLENMLLEAAGRTSSPHRKRHNSNSTSSKPRNQKSKRGDDAGSESRGEDSDAEGGGASKKKPPSSSRNVPLKKRLDLTKTERELGHEGELLEDDDDDDEDEESDVGSDLYKNEDDKQRLANMTELEREMILSDRAAKKGEKEFKEQLRMKRDTNNNATSKNMINHQSPLPPPPPPSSSSKVRSSTRHAERTAAKGDVLSELRAKRMKQQVVDTHHGKPSSSSTNKGIPMKKKAVTTSSSSSQSESGDSDRDSSEGLADSDDDDDKNMLRESNMPTFEEIKEITIRRSRLVKWLNEPFFEELIVGCFVRIGIGKSESGAVYRLCMVQSVDCGDPNRHYKVENRITHKYLVCVWGSESSAKRFQMAVVSDSSPLEKEFRQWVREIERSCSQMPSKASVLDKREAIRRTNNYVYSAATVKQMLEEKKAAPTRPLNVAVEKDKLKRLMEVAKSKNDEAEVQRICAKLLELDAAREARDNDSRAKRLAEMNRKNKVDNFKNLSNKKRVEEPSVSAGNAVGFKATEAALEAAASAGKLVDTLAPVDCGTESNMMHDFELPISLAELKDLGGPQGLKNGFLARKQKIEATVGLQVPENDGGRHALTLTISDYKRRRGLL
ncbi:protein RTF1 homolog [Arachis duranensis]|uniref:Protein RTF1 homolog n=1 Tax=Arachis duranensis TaxID=130453 RepID=A0A6P4DQY4_ARADU|nr:protein RTF1 homolog [Arachis duranensis]